MSCSSKLMFKWKACDCCGSSHIFFYCVMLRGRGGDSHPYPSDYAPAYEHKRNVPTSSRLGQLPALPPIDVLRGGRTTPTRERASSRILILFLQDDGDGVYFFHDDDGDVWSLTTWMIWRRWRMPLNGSTLRQVLLQRRLRLTQFEAAKKYDYVTMTPKFANLRGGRLTLVGFPNY